jgi:hypothetical protein
LAATRVDSSACAEVSKKPKELMTRAILVDALVASNYEQARELVAVVRGSDGGRRMYGTSDALPEVYKERFRTQMYSDRVVHRGVWNKVVVVAHEDDDEAMLNNALIQSRRRHAG